MKKKNILGHQNQYQLTRWLEANWERLTVAKMSMSEAAESAKRELKFEVTVGNIQSSIKALGRGWPSERANNHSNISPKRFSRLVHAIRETLRSFDASLAETFDKHLANGDSPAPEKQTTINGI